MFRFPQTNIIGIPAGHGTPAFPIQTYLMESTGLDQTEYSKFKSLENWFKREADNVVASTIVNDKDRAKSEGKKRLNRPASIPGGDAPALQPSYSEGIPITLSNNFKEISYQQIQSLMHSLLTALPSSVLQECGFIGIKQIFCSGIAFYNW